MHIKIFSYEKLKEKTEINSIHNMISFHFYVFLIEFKFLSKII